MPRQTQTGRWQAVWRVPGKEGKWQQRSQVCGSKEEAEKLETRMKELVSGGVGNGLTREHVRDYLPRWLSQVQPFISETTHFNYTWCVEKYLIPRLGAYRLTDLNPRIVSSFVTGLFTSPGVSGKDLSHNTISRIYAVLRIALNSAVEHGDLLSNPCSRLPRRQRPAQREVSPSVLNEDEIRRVIATSQDSTAGVLFLLALTCGLRRGELCALKWSHLDLDQGLLRVEESYRQVSSSNFSVGAPKNNGKRSIPIPAFVIPVLQQHQQRLDFMAATVPGWQDHNLVFPGSSGNYRNPNDIHRTLHRYQDRVGLQRFRLHDLRHTFGTLSVGKNRDIVEVAKMMGHHDKAFTLRVYAHGLGQQQQMQEETWKDVTGQSEV